MGEVHLSIPAVYSAYSYPTKNLAGTRLLQHQVETLEALNDSEVDVVINTAMTGDGKSLAAYLLAFQQGQHLIAMYPTNELIRDQHVALQQYRETSGIRFARDAMMFGERITQLMRDHEETSRLEEVKKLLMHHGILLTNPDLVHLIMSYQYGWDYMLKELPVATGANFDYFLFDEFHTFAVPQVISVVNMLGYLHATYGNKPNERRKYLFLSATPTPLLEKMLARSGLRCKVIQGHYSRSDEGGAYRCILQPCTISLEAVNQEQSTEQWIEGHLPQLLQFFQQHKDDDKAKAAILVYSPATARRLFIRLKEYFEPLGITVGENSGLTPMSERRDALMKHILVGTSTVDIGIDFHINYLIFEAFNAGSFLQRFGRLGRHKGFSEYRAYALVPHFIRERLAQVFEGQTEVERSAFNTAVREAYPTEQEFAGYTQRWGVVQAAHVLEVLKSQQKKDQNQEFYAALTQQYEQIYGTPEKSVMAKAAKKYWAIKQQSRPVLDDLLSFRGQSPLSCGVWDTTTTETGDALLTYDLFFLLANTEFEVIDEDSFMQEVRRRSLEERDFRGKRFYLKVYEYVPERRNLILGRNINLSEYPDTLHRLAVWDGLFVREPRHIWLNEIDRHLKRLKLTCIISDLKPQELKVQLKLGGVFPVYRLQDSAGSEYSIVFGQEALLLDSLLAYRKPKGNNAMMA